MNSLWTVRPSPGGLVRRVRRERRSPSEGSLRRDLLLLYLLLKWLTKKILARWRTTINESSQSKELQLPAARSGAAIRTHVSLGLIVTFLIHSFIHSASLKLIKTHPGVHGGQGGFAAHISSLVFCNDSFVSSSLGGKVGDHKTLLTLHRMVFNLFSIWQRLRGELEKDKSSELIAEVLKKVTKRPWLTLLKIISYS